MTKTTTDIQAFINDHPFSKYQWMILALCFVTVAMDGFDTAIIGFIASDLVQEWGVQKSDLGPVMSAALVGLAVGALTAGPMADRIGRKKVLVLSILVFGGFSLVTAFATNLTQLTLLRFLTGLGLGAAMPNAATLMSEYAPERRRALLVNLMFVGFPIGSSMGGFISAWLIPHYGWQSVLIRRRRHAAGAGGTTVFSCYRNLRAIWWSKTSLSTKSPPSSNVSPLWRITRVLSYRKPGR
jgi:Arabinose efflux permease